jgi:hypothetical protein
MEKKGGYQGIRIEMMNSQTYTVDQSERHRIERNYWKAKEYDKLRSCRHLGQARYAIQAYLTAIALNVERTEKSVTGVNSQGR